MSKIGLALTLTVISFLLCGCISTEELYLAEEDDNIIGEAFKYSAKVYAPRNNSNLDKIKTSAENRDNYVEVFDLQTMPLKMEFSKYYFKNLNYLGNLGPFPTKSLQSHLTLKKYGIIDSEAVDLKGFYLLSGPQTNLTNIVQDHADLIQNGTTTEETVKKIMEWEHAILSCSSEEAQKYKKRERTAHEIILSKCASGCTDYVLVFAALARAKGIPATVTETIREKWVTEMVWNNQWNGAKEGHFFSEVFLSEKNVWVVADPTANKLTGRDEKGYYPSGPNGDKRFMLFERGLDSWDYGLKTDAEFGLAVKKRYYIEGEQP